MDKEAQESLARALYERFHGGNWEDASAPSVDYFWSMAHLALTTVINAGYRKLPEGQPPRRWIMESRHTDPTIMVCPDCGWTGQLKDCTHTYVETTGEDVEPISNCPKCGGSDIIPKE